MAGGAGPLNAGVAEIDVPTAKEFIDEVHRHVGQDELTVLHAELAEKAAFFAARLAPGAIDELDGAGLREVLERTFVARRRASAVLGVRSDAELRTWVGDLLHGTDPLATRFDRFCADVELPRAKGLAAEELAAELLHFGDPRRYWLWARWMWAPDARTGALPLLIGEDFDLEDDSGAGAIYERVGTALAALDDSPEAASFRRADGSDVPIPRLGTDLFLVCVYGVYMRTVLGLKMTSEFNSIVPPIPQLARRLLGTHQPTHEEN